MSLYYSCSINFICTRSKVLLPLLTSVSPPPWVCPHNCPHQGICMWLPREDLPLQVWDKSSALVLLWLIRISSNFWTWGSLLSSWSSSCSGPQVGMERGWEGGCREWWALGQHCFSCVFVHMLDAHLILCKGHVMFINMRMRMDVEGTSMYALVVTEKEWASGHEL